MRTKKRKITGLVRDYTFFFCFNAFIITCSMMLFVSTLSKTMKIDLNGEILRTASRFTFFNVLFLTVLITAIDYIRRRVTVINPIKRINEASEKMINGDFSVRLKTINTYFADESFNNIIDCFNKIAEELSGVETLRTDFIANVSHELKTPIAVVQNYATLLQATEMDDKTRIAYATSVSNSCRRLSDLVSNILKLNKLENQQIFPDVEEYNLGEQLCECFLQFESVIEEKGLEIEVDIEENVMIKAEMELLSCVWNNLLSNAVKFTDCGGRISLSMKSDSRFVTVKVKDTGCGMSKEEGEHIFDKFYQGDASHAMQGNGLGLALVKRVVDIMNGEICVESVLQQGSTFTVKIPRS